ncbi:M1 family metallopeptidase [soil metagenome]
MTGFRLPTDARPTRYTLRFDLDLEAWRFQARERCELVLERPRRAIVLHAVDLEIHQAVARAGGHAVRARPSFDPETQTVTLGFDDELGPGQWLLELALAGEIRPDLKALYRSTRGSERYALTTLWPAESRRLYACFDEPPFKARFALELVTAADLTAIANARLVERSDDGPGRARWRFAETPPLSPYLLAFAVGPFDGTDVVTTRSGLPVRIWVPRGLARDAEFARDTHRDCVDLLEEYTGVPYPYDKVEGIGVADFPAGAMENPGAVTYRLELVAADPTTTSSRALKLAVGVTAHELTHMWWGNLVTLAWWDDLWLSESFAQFVGNKIEHALYPEWAIWRDFVTGTTRGFAMDALASTHAIHAEADTAGAALQRVDAITYQKGAAVLRMIETYLGEEVFRAAVHIYLERFREATATAADFWTALDEASGQDVTRVAKAWITEPGHPIVDLSEESGRLIIGQRRFFRDPEEPATPQLWPVPLVLRSPRGETRVLLDAQRGSLESTAGEWLHPNARSAGFYRFSLRCALRDRLLAHLGECSPEERLLVLDNEWALLQAGASGAADHVALLRSLAGERDRAVLAVALDQLQWLAAHALPRGAEVTFAMIVERIFGPVLARLGLDPVAGEDDDEQELRALALRAMGELAASPKVRQEAGSRIRTHLDGRTQDRNLIGALAAVAAIDGDAALQQRFAEKIRGNDPQEAQRFLSALSVFRDDAATRATLANVDDRTIRDQDLQMVLSFGLRNRVQRRTYWRAFTERYRERIEPLEAILRNGLLYSLSQLTPPDLAREADAFLASVDAPDGREVVTRARESLRLQSAAARRISAELATALKGEPTGKTDAVPA